MVLASVQLLLTTKTGQLVTVRSLGDNAEEVIAISRAGKTIRIALKNVPTLGRSTQGVRIMRLNKTDQVASAVIVEIDPVVDDDDSADSAKSASAAKKSQESQETGNQKATGGQEVTAFGPLRYNRDR